MPQVAKSDTEIENCFAVMSELRPHLRQEEFLPLVRSMEPEGFRLAYIEDGGKIVCVSGYRVSTNLFMGKNLYVDDLSTSEKHRSKGYGEQMLDWLRSLAKAEGCNVLHLDSGTQRKRAHKFYLCQGLQISSFHFGEELK